MKFLNCPTLILLSGTPGTGKSTISRMMKQKFSWSEFNLGEFIIQRELYEYEDGNDAIKNIDEETAAIECVLELFRICQKEIKSWSNIGNETKLNPIIVDSHYADIILDGIKIYNQNPDFYLEKIGYHSDEDTKNICISKYTNKNNIFGIILRCNPSELEIRLNKRDYSADKIQENIQAEILGESTNNMLEVLDEEKIFEIDTSINEISQICKNIENIVLHSDKNRKNFGYGTINWMNKLVKEGKLKEYFKNKLGLKRIITDFQDVDKLEE